VVETADLSDHLTPLHSVNATSHVQTAEQAGNQLKLAVLSIKLNRYAGSRSSNLKDSLGSNGTAREQYENPYPRR
jgi:hypothetical protein